MGFFEPHIKQYDRLVALAQTAASGAPVARQIDSPTWETEILETLQPGASGAPEAALALDARKWSQSLSPQQQKLRELRQQLNEINDEIKRLSDRPLERETKRFEMARVRRQASAAALQLIAALETRFAADEAKRGELLELKGECLQEEGAAFAAGVVFATMMHSRHGAAQPTSEASKDPLWLNAEAKSLKHLITHETSRQGLRFTEEEAETLASQLSDLEKQKANNPMDTLDQELGSLAFRKKLHDIELEELTGEVLGFISRQKRSIAGKILDFVWDVAAEITPSDQIKYISTEIQKLDREVMTGWGKTLIMAPTQADMLQRSQRLLEVTRMVEQHKAKLLQTLSEALPMPQNEAQHATWADLVDRISRLKQDYKEADTEFAVKQMAYRILAEEPSLPPDERNAIVTDLRSGFHFLEAFQGLLLAGRLTTGWFTLAQSTALRKELQKLTVDCLAETKKVIDELEQLKQEKDIEMNSLTSWLENPDKEGRVSAETEPKANRLQEVKIELKDISATLKEFYGFVKQYEIQSTLNQAEELFDEEMSKAEKLIQDLKQDGEAAINVAVQLGIDLGAIIHKLSQAASSQFFTSSHRQRLDQLNSRRSDLESQISSWRQEYQERMPRLFRQDLSDQLKNKKLLDPNPKPKLKDPNLQKITYIEPWSTSPLWKGGQEKDLSQATIVARGIQRAKIALDFTEEARISLQQAMGGDSPIRNGDLKSQLKNRVDLYLIDIMRIDYLELFINLSVERSKLLKGILPDSEIETDCLDPYRQELAQLTAQYGSAEKSSLKQKTTDLSTLERLVERVQSAPTRLNKLAERYVRVEGEVNSSIDEDKKMSHLEELYQINLEREKAIQEVIDAQNSLQHLFTTEELDHGEISWLKQDLVERKKVLQEQKAILNDWNLGKPLRTLDLQIDQLPDGLEKDRLEVQRGQELDRLLRIEKDRLEIQRGQGLGRPLPTRPKSRQQQDPYPLLYYGRLAHDPQRRFSVAMARLRILEDQLQQQLVTPLELGQDWEGLRDAVTKNGQLLEEMRLELVRAQWAASSASKNLPESGDNNVQELVNHCKSLLRECQQQQKVLYHHYNEASQQLLPTEETTNIWQYLHELAPAIEKTERKFVAWIEEEWGPILFRDDPSCLPALKLAEEKILEARAQRNEIVKELLSLQTQLKSEKGSSERMKLEELQKQTIGTYRKSLQYERDLQVQKHGMILNRILKVTTQISQQRLQILGKKPNAEAPVKVENEIITNQLKLEQQETVAELDASLEILQRAFNEEIRAYSSYPDPQLTLQELLTKELKGAAEELISLASLKETIHKPEEFRMRWEAAQLGYEWKSAAKEFLQKEGESIPQLLSKLVNEFLSFAEQHPGLAEALVTDIAITIDLLGDQTALTTLINGMHSRLLARGVIRGMGWGDEAEPPLEPKDLKWLALVDAGRYFPLAATGVQTAQAAVAGIKRAGLTGGLISALKAAVLKIPTNQLIQRIAKQTAPEHLDVVETTLRTLRGDSLGTLLASRQRVVAAQLAGELAAAYFRPVAFLKGLANAIKGLTAEYHSSEPLEKQLRIGAVVGIPLAGLALLPALVWSVGLLFAGLIATGAVTMGPIYAWRWINRAYPDTRKRVEVEERHAWVEKHPEFFQRLYEQQDAILASLQQTGAVPTSLAEDPALALVVGPSDLERMKNQAVETCRKEIEELYQIQTQTGGELQTQEVISLYLTHSYAQVDAMVGSQFPAVKDSLRQYLKDRVRLELYESWLKPKVHEACAYEFTVMVARYGSPKKFVQVMGRPRPGTQPIPLTVEEANRQKQAAFNAAAQKVKAALAKGKSVEVI